jgi:tRNA(adenine34) deaminase
MTAGLFSAPLAAREEKIRRILLPWSAYSGIDPAERDRFFMDAAIALAKVAAEEGEVPVGCVIAREDRIVSGEYNGREGLKNALWHAETAAIDRACLALGGWRLPGCTLYVTLEPCPMCAGAIWNARIPRVAIGAKDARAGAMGSLLNLASYPLNPKPEVTFGVREAECRELLRAFFRKKRNGTAEKGD